MQRALEAGMIAVERAFATVVGEGERGNPRQISLKCQDEQVQHQADVLLIARGDAGGLGQLGRAFPLGRRAPGNQNR